MKSKIEALAAIGANITFHRYHIYIVDGVPCPQFAYTIGLSRFADFELVFAGGAFYSVDEIAEVLNRIAEEIRTHENWRDSEFNFEQLGRFSLGEVDSSWSQKLILGALDYFKVAELSTLQVRPDPQHWTIDIPNMKRAWNPAEEPIWQWLDGTTISPLLANSRVTTNIEALKGKPITEVMRWGENEWELIAGSGPDVMKHDIRIVPFGTLLGADSSLEVIFRLEIGKGLWRDPVHRVWHQWE